MNLELGMRLIKDMHTSQYEKAMQTLDPKSVGVFNGLELALATLEDRTPDVILATSLDKVLEKVYLADGRKVETGARIIYTSDRGFEYEGYIATVLKKYTHPRCNIVITVPTVHDEFVPDVALRAIGYSKEKKPYSWRWAE